MTKKVGTATFVDGLDRVIQLKTDVDYFDGNSAVTRHRVSGITAYNKFALEITGRLDFLSRRERVLNLTPQYARFQLIKRTLLSKSTR